MRGCDSAEIADTLARLHEQGLQSDRRFASAYAESKARRGYGPLRIKQELRARGVADAAIGEALDSAVDAFADSAESALRKKFKTAPASMPERARQTRFLEYRGFAADHIRQALRQFSEQ